MTQIILRRIALVLLVEWFVCDMFAQTSSPATFWRKLIAEKSLPEIAVEMGAETAPAWPEVRSVRQETGADGVNKIALIKDLHEKLRLSFENEKGTLDALAVYAKITKLLQTSGGYSNILLADCFNRVVFFRLTEALAADRRKFGELKALANGWKVPSVPDAKVWYARFQNDDPRVKEVLEDPERPINGVDLIDPNKRTFVYLMEQPSVLVLILRVAEMEMAKTVNLMGFVSFLEKGGTREEVANAKDNSSFLKRMGDEVGRYRYEPFAKLYLARPDIERCYLLHSDPVVKDNVLGPALK